MLIHMCTHSYYVHHWLCGYLLRVSNKLLAQKGYVVKKKSYKIGKDTARFKKSFVCIICGKTKHLKMHFGNEICTECVNSFKEIVQHALNI